ncbi:hypothetical protein MnTg02_01819 [bacterium MnTg02]|nr:hypothetical protein MnTg02_01819 [bacterium MnTg02]
MRSKSAILVILLSAAVAVLSGCKAEEQGRPTTYEKGVYGGKADKKLTGEQVRSLRHRGGLQRQ